MRKIVSFLAATDRAPGSGSEGMCKCDALASVLQEELPDEGPDQPGKRQFGLRAFPGREAKRGALAVSQHMRSASRAESSQWCRESSHSSPVGGGSACVASGVKRGVRVETLAGLQSFQPSLLNNSKGRFGFQSFGSGFRG